MYHACLNYNTLVYSNFSGDLEINALWLVEDCVISCYNYPMRGDYNTETLIFKIAAAWFLDVFEEETNKNYERKCSFSDNHLSTKTIILLWFEVPPDFLSGIIWQ